MSPPLKPDRKKANQKAYHLSIFFHPFPTLFESAPVSFLLSYDNYLLSISCLYHSILKEKVESSLTLFISVK